VHPFPTATVVLMSAGLLIVARGQVPQVGFSLRAVGAVLMTQVATGALNDYVDRESDATRQRDKPIPSGRAGPRTALALVAAGLTGVAVLGASFGPGPFFLLAFATAGGLAYDLWLKPTAFSIVAYLIGFLGLITWIWLVAGHLAPLFVLVYPLGTAAILTAHLAQSLPDIESDRAGGHHGLAATLGVRTTALTVRAGLVATMAGSLLLATLARSAWGLLPVIAGTTIGLYALVGSGRDVSTRSARLSLFHLAAVAIALLAIGALASLKALGA
jgi:4-hydroxybenzoate polyprenyltransferase